MPLPPYNRNRGAGGVPPGEYLCVISEFNGPKVSKKGDSTYYTVVYTAIGNGAFVREFLSADMSGELNVFGQRIFNDICVNIGLIADDSTDIMDIQAEDFIGAPINLEVVTEGGFSNVKARFPVTDDQKADVAIWLSDHPQGTKFPYGQNQ